MSDDALFHLLTVALAVGGADPLQVNRLLAGSSMQSQAMALCCSGRNIQQSVFAISSSQDE
jgi:hypothetical protein